MSNKMSFENIQIDNFLINENDPNIISQDGDPLWFFFIQKKRFFDLQVLLNNNVNVSIRNKNNDSWALACIENDVPEYIFMEGLIKDDSNWFKSNMLGKSPFFNEKLNNQYAEIIGRKYWGDLGSWKELKNENGLDPVAFFKKKVI